MKRELLKIAKEFRKGFLDSRPSNDMCFILSSSLGGYLKFCGYDCELIEGGVSGHHHYWIQVGDNIIDATADQFKTPGGGDMPPVYIGVKPEWYKINQDMEAKKETI